MDTTGTVILLLCLVALASMVVAGIAEDRGRSGWRFFLLSFFLSPLIALIILFISNQPSQESDVVKLEKLSALHDKGILSDEEFNRAKAKALA